MCKLYILKLNVLLIKNRKFGRTKSKTQLSKREQGRKSNSSTSTTNCNEPLKKAMKLSSCEEDEYNDNNLYFYCFYYDKKSKRINVLPNNVRNLKNRYIKSLNKK